MKTLALSSSPPSHKTWKDVAPYFENLVTVKRYKPDSLDFVAWGAEALVFKAICQGENEASPDQRVALRITPGPTKKHPDIDSTSTVQFRYYLQFSSLLNHPEHGPLTEAFPDLFAVYYTREIPLKIIPRWPTALCPHKRAEFWTEVCDSFLVTEMTFVDTTFEIMFKEESPIPASVVFEYVWGTFIAGKILGIIPTDPDGNQGRNNGLHKVSYERCYHCGEEVYRFGPGFMPIYLDLADVRAVGTQKMFQFQDYLGTPADPSTARFLQALKAPKEDLFSLFSEHFSSFRITSEEASSLDPTTTHHFHIPQSIIDEEKAFFVP